MVYDHGDPHLLDRTDIPGRWRKGWRALPSLFPSTQRDRPCHPKAIRSANRPQLLP